MIFGGIQKNSLIDYPGKVSCVLFLAGCNFDCPYCHNPALVKGYRQCPSIINPREVFEFLEKRKGFLDGVVVSGGEPTLHDNLLRLCEKIKEMDFSIKLDTNGSRPAHLEELIKSGLVDYIAMDIKTDPRCYEPLINKNHNPMDLYKSINIIMDSAPDYEFRTTCVEKLVDEKIIETIARIIKGAKRYALQLFKRVEVLHPEFFVERDADYSIEDLLYLKSLAEPWVRECLVR